MSKKSNVSWTLDACKLSAGNYLKRTDWSKGHSAAYQFARRKGWLDDCCSHMPKYSTKYNWTRELLIEDARKHDSRTKWAASGRGAHSAAKRKGWLDECCSHMPPSEGASERKWTLEVCQASALNYKTRSEWAKGDKGAYWAAGRFKFSDKCTGHMDSGYIYWTKERCIADAANYPHKSNWAEGSCSAYHAALDNGWISECCTHMTRRKKWTLEACVDSTKGYKKQIDWMNGNPSAYMAARNSGWIDKCCFGMIRSVRWTRELCLEDAKKHSTRGEWSKAKGGGYAAARKWGWLDRSCAHMRSKSRNPTVGFGQAVVIINSALPIRNEVNELTCN